jgi:hypothetical protein
VAHVIGPLLLTFPLAGLHSCAAMAARCSVPRILTVATAHPALTGPLVVVRSGSQNGPTVPDISHALRWFCAEARSYHLVARNVKLTAVSGAYPQVTVSGNYIMEHLAVLIGI